MPKRKTPEEIAEEQRLARLAGDEKGGGGLPLPILFSALLNELLDKDSLSDERAAEITTEVLAGYSARLAETWGGKWDALAGDATAQMERKAIIKRDGDGAWAVGPEFHAGQFLEIIPKWNGQPPDGTMILEAADREAADTAQHLLRTHAENDAQAVMHGFRHVTKERMDLIRESMELLGDLRDYFPVLLDTEGNVIDGRHRRAIDHAWPASPVKVQPEDRVSAGLAANRTNAWTGKDWKDLRAKAEAEHGKQEAARVVIRLALLEDASRSNRQIAELVGVSQNTVIAERGVQIEHQHIHCYEFPKGGNSRTGKHSAACWCGEGQAEPRPHSPGQQASPRSYDDATQEAVIAEATRRLKTGEKTDFRGLAAQFNVGEGFVQRMIAVAKDRIDADRRQRQEQEAAQQATAATVNPPSPEPEPGPPPQPVTGNASAESAWSKIMSRLGRLAEIWRSGPPDPASEREELLAMRNDIDERLKALGG